MTIDGLILLAGLMFLTGVMGVLLRRNAIVIFMSLELMFNAANLAFITFAAQYGVLSGQVFVFYIMTVAAAEVAIGLALIVAIFRQKHSVDIDDMNLLKD
jgi:NADH-quinone oxidoreductase subunit K